MPQHELETTDTCTYYPDNCTNILVRTQFLKTKDDKDKRKNLAKPEDGWCSEIKNIQMKDLKEWIENNPHSHETWHGPCRLFIDFDKSYGPNTQETNAFGLCPAADLLARNWQKDIIDVHDALNDKIEELYPDSDFVINILSASGLKQSKNEHVSSFHMIVSDLGYQCCTQAWYDTIIKELSERFPAIDCNFGKRSIDSKQNKRLINCTKPTDPKRKLIPMKIENNSVVELKDYRIEDYLVSYIEDEKYIPSEKDYNKHYANDTQSGVVFQPVGEAEEKKNTEYLDNILSVLDPKRGAEYNDYFGMACIIMRVCNAMGINLNSGFELARKFVVRCHGSEGKIGQVWETLKTRLTVGRSLRELKKMANDDCPNWYLQELEDEQPKESEDYDIDITKWIEIAKNISTEEQLNNMKDKLVEYMNKFYCYMPVGRDVSILKIKGLSSANNFEILPSYLTQTEKVFKGFLMNKNLTVTINEKKQQINLADLWLTSLKRSEKTKTTFNPKPDFKCDKTFNLFSGLAIKKEDVQSCESLAADSPLLYHIKHRWCNDDEKLFRGVIGRFATWVQRPWVKHGTVIILQGEEGSGKGIVIEKLTEILGMKYVAKPSTASHVLGDFNSLVEGKLVVFLDEMTWGGNKEQEGVLKKLTTESVISFNHKFVAPYCAETYHNLIIATNNEWVWPTSDKTRRILVLECKNELAGSPLTEEQAAIVHAIRSTDVKQFARYLYDINLDSAEYKDITRQIVKTDGFRKQQMCSFDRIEANIYDMLNTGTIQVGINKVYVSNNSTLTKDEFYESMVPKDMQKFSQYRNNMFYQKLKLKYPCITDHRPTINGQRVQCLKFPHIDVLRNAFMKARNDFEWPWDAPDEEVEEPEEP